MRAASVMVAHLPCKEKDGFKSQRVHTMKTFDKIISWVSAIPKDKLLHAAAGGFITLLTFALAVIFFPFWTSFIAANIISFAALVGKEFYDFFTRGSVEIEDIFWGVLGSVVVDLPILILGLVL